MPKKPARREEWQIDEHLLDAQVAIDNSIAESAIGAALRTFGYDGDKLQEGKAVLDAATDLNHKQKAEYGDQYAATGAVKEAWAAIKRPYMKSLAIARVAFKRDLEALAAVALADNLQDLEKIGFGAEP